MVRGTDCVSWSLTLEAKDVETGGIVSLAILETSQTHTNTNEEKHTNTQIHKCTNSWGQGRWDRRIVPRSVIWDFRNITNTQMQNTWIGKHISTQKKTKVVDSLHPAFVHFEPSNKRILSFNILLSQFWTNYILVYTLTWAFKQPTKWLHLFCFNIWNLE